MKLEQNLIRYIDAGFPILYIHSYEEKKVDDIIKKSACGRRIFEWNGVAGFTDFDTKTSMSLACLLYTSRCV